MICFDNVSKAFKLGLGKKVTAVKELAFSVKRGEVFGIIGPNGAGKSTTIKMLLNLIRPDTGKIHINGISSDKEISRSNLGYLSENPCLYDYLTATEFLYYAGSISKMGKTAIVERSKLLFEKLKLDNACNRHVSTYSKGMQQRTAIAAALIHDPELVILDEPMSGLDPLGRKLIFDLIAELKQQGKTVFISSHVLTDIERLCDRVGIIVQGRLSFIDNVDQLDGALENIFLRVVDEAGVSEVK